MTDVKNTIHRILNKAVTPQDIMSIVRDALKMLMPLVKAYLDARAKYNRSSSIKNGSEMQEARNALKVAYDNTFSSLMERRESEWGEIVSARDMENIIEAHFMDMTKEKEVIE